MAQARRSGRGPDYNWAAFELGGTFSGVATGTVTSLEGAIFSEAQTIMRIRGELVANLDLSGSAAGDACVMSLGLIMGLEGATQTQSPLLGAGPYIWYTKVCLSTETVIGAAATDFGAIGATARIVVDTKAMRKVKDGTSLFFVQFVQSVSGAPVTNLIGGVRLLTAR